MPRCKTRKLCKLLFIGLVTWIILQISLASLYGEDHNEDIENVLVENPLTSKLVNELPLKKQEMDHDKSIYARNEKVVNNNEVTNSDPKNGLPLTEETLRVNKQSLDEVQENNFIISMREVDRAVQNARRVLETGEGETKLSEGVLIDYDMHQADRIGNTGQRLNLFVAVISHPAQLARRTAIRQTWLKHCQSKEIMCKFFTDGEGLHSSLLQRINAEQNLNKDLEFLRTSPGPLMSGSRFLQVLKWVKERYNPEFFLKVDDDRFLCVRRLLFDLEFRPTNYLIWGNIHCQFKAVRMDDSFVLLSGKLMQHLLSDESSLLCHPFADQQTALWLNNLKDHDKVLYFDDTRRVHTYTAYKDLPSLTGDESICSRYLSVRRVNEMEMQSLWNGSKNDSLEKYEVPPIYYKCMYSNQFEWNRICNLYKTQQCDEKYEPKLCKDGPIWAL